MKHGAVLALGLSSLLVACATSSSPNAAAEAQCSYLARSDGLRLHSVDGVRSNADGVVALNVKVEDAVGRRLATVCNYTVATNKANWAQPLPEGLRRS
jgi:hypothetical protein